MALKINWKYNGKEIEAYLRIALIGNTRNLSGISSFARVGGGEQTSSGFKFIANYEIYLDKEYTKRISEGAITRSLDLNSNDNTFVQAYNALKELTYEFGNTTDL